jgi:catechol 2,3-dioxygenase-like lactoylglutathione lyase family enzyme
MFPKRAENMGVLRLEHVTIRCAQRQATRDFYVELIGLTEGARPNFPFRGHWLYLGGTPVIHLVEALDHPGAWSGAGTSGLGGSLPGRDTGAFDHVAFRGTDFDAMRQKLVERGIAFRERVVPGRTLKQLFIPDPEGIMVELNFED